MGFYQNSANRESNSTINSIASTGSDPSGNIDNLLQELAAQGRQFANDIGGPLAGGSADALTITLSSGNLAANYDGFLCGFIAAYDNLTVTTTAQIAGGAAAAQVYKAVNGVRTQLAAGDIQADSYYFLRYRQSWGGWQLVDLNHPEASAITVGFSNLDAALVVTASETIASNDNDTTLPTCAAVIDYVASAISGQAPTATVPVGTVSDYGGSTAPTGWLLCYGQAISRTTYVSLYAVLGTTFGSGDGSTTFNVPDCRGRVVAGKDNMGGTSANRLTGQTGGINGDNLGATGGAETHALTSTQVPANAQETVVDGTGSSATIPTTAHTGTGAAHNNIQPTIILSKIIYAGV
jgi:microcystin-dependent protein